MRPACAAMACMSRPPGANPLCPKHLKMVPGITASSTQADLRAAVIAIAKKEGYLAPDPHATRARINHRDHDPIVDE